MKHYGDRVEDMKIAYIGGGSRGWAWGLMSDLAAQDKMSGRVALYDIDHQAAADNQIIGNKYNSLPDSKSQWDYSAAASLGEALQGADYVVISILPGTFDEMAVDVHEPEKYGILQTVGDTVGPGGIIRAMRTVPMFEEIALAIKEYCPEAWVVNYTNPMTMCVRTLYRVFPQIKAYGCCHEVFGGQGLLGIMLDEMEGLKITDPVGDIKINVYGINHFTWIDRAQYQGRDILPLYAQFSEKYHSTGFRPEDDGYLVSPFFYSHRVKFDLFQRYGIMAAAGDRHLAEFCPPWYLKDKETMLSWKFNQTPVTWRVDELKTRLNKKDRLVSGEQPVEIWKTGELGTVQMHAILGLGDLITNVNIPNMGQIPNLPIGAVVETNAVFSHNSLRPLTAGCIPDTVHSLVYRHVINQETTVAGALARDKDQVFTAFVNDPLVTLSLRDARNLFDEMVRNTSRFLPDWKLG